MARLRSTESVLEIARRGEAVHPPTVSYALLRLVLLVALIMALAGVVLGFDDAGLLVGVFGLVELATGWVLNRLKPDTRTAEQRLAPPSSAESATSAPAT